MRKEVCELKNQGKSVEDIMATHGLSRQSVNRYLRVGGLGSGSGGQNRVLNREVFRDLKCYNTQYWVGYLAADGCLHAFKNKRSIAVTSIDKVQLENYVQWLNAPIKIHTISGRNIYHVVVGGFENYKALEVLWGLTPRKSLTFKPFRPLTWEFVRGYFDGNGYAPLTNRTRPMFVSGSMDFINALSNFLNTQYIDHTVRWEKPTVGRVHINSVSWKRFYNLMYENGDYKLQRKYDRMTRLVETRGQ